MWEPSVCTKDCPDTCGLLAKVENGIITRVKGDPDHPFTQGFICKKAGFFPGHVHNENRIITPIRRTGPSTDIESAVDSDFIIIWGNNSLTTNVHAWPFYKKAMKKGARLVVIDPYRTRTAKEADIHLMAMPGTDAALALGMMQILIEEDLIDLDYLAQPHPGRQGSQPAHQSAAHGPGKYLRLPLQPGGGGT